MIKAIVTDFGGVLTTPLADAFAAFHADTGVSPAELFESMEEAFRERGTHPLHEMEKGLLTEADFIAQLDELLEKRLGRTARMSDFREIYFQTLSPNETMIDLMADLRERRYRMALLTNNIREWEPLWKSMAPIDDLFEVVVDSSNVGLRKPEPEIYSLTLDRLGMNPAECLFVDDMEVNCFAASELGFQAVCFRDNDQAIAEIEAALSDPSD